MLDGISDNNQASAATDMFVGVLICQNDGIYESSVAEKMCQDRYF